MLTIAKYVKKHLMLFFKPRGRLDGVIVNYLSSKQINIQLTSSMGGKSEQNIIIFLKQNICNGQTSKSVILNPIYNVQFSKQWIQIQCGYLYCSQLRSTIQELDNNDLSAQIKVD